MYEDMFPAPMMLRTSCVRPKITKLPSPSIMQLCALFLRVFSHSYQPQAIALIPFPSRDSITCRLHKERCTYRRILAIFKIVVSETSDASASVAIDYRPRTCKKHTRIATSGRSSEQLREGRYLLRPSLSAMSSEHNFSRFEAVTKIVNSPRLCNKQCHIPFSVCLTSSTCHFPFTFESVTSASFLPLQFTLPASVRTLLLRGSQRSTSDWSGRDS